MQEAIYLLANQPASVSYSYAILCFWASVANLKYSKSNAIGMELFMKNIYL